MKDYTVWMDVTETWKVSFKANDLDEAKRIVQQLNTGEINSDEVTDYDERNKGLESEYAVDTLEEFDFTKGATDEG